MQITESSEQGERRAVWYDGSAICVIVVGSHGDPQDLSDHEVLDLIRKLEVCLAESQGRQASSDDPVKAHDRARLRKSWTITRRHLAACRFLLPEHLVGAAAAAESELNHFVHHNEFGLALEAAEALGEAVDSPAEFWLELELAARNMSLAEKAAQYAARRDA